MQPGRQWIAFRRSASIVVALQGPPGRISLFSATCDGAGNEFRLLHTWRLPISGDHQLLAAGSVSCIDLGLYRAYIVMCKQSDLWVGQIAERSDVVECEVQFSLQGLFSTGKRSTGFKASKHMEGCWLVDGPRVICLYKGKLLVASKFSGSHWDVDVFELCEPDRQLRVHLCETEAVLSIDSSTSGSWSYYSLVSSGRSYNVASNWRLTSSAKILRQRCDLFPVELHPRFISCSTFIPPRPSVAISCLVDADSLSQPPPELLIGTLDRKLLRCRNGVMLQTTSLEAVPDSMTFFVARNGQGAVLIQVSSTVLVLCAESLERLEAYSGVSAAFAVDLQRAGHEQVAVLSLSCKPSTDDFVKSLRIVDAIPESAECEGHKMLMMQTAIKILEARKQNGLVHLECLKEQKMQKLDLLRSSCWLLQDVLKKRLGAANQQTTGITVEKANHFVCKGRLVIIVSLQNCGLSLSNAALLVTSIQGCIESKSTRLDSSKSEGRFQELLVAVPLSNVPVQTLQALNVILVADASNGGTFLHWLCRVNTNWTSLLQGDVPIQVPECYRNINEEIQLALNGDWVQLADIVKSCLHMETANVEEGKKIELVGKTWFRWGEAVVSSTRRGCALLTLRAETMQDLVVLQGLLERKLKAEGLLAP